MEVLAKAIADGVLRVKEIGLSSNPIGNEGLQALCDGLVKANTPLTKWWLYSISVYSP